jgi:hypothetical protein
MDHNPYNPPRTNTETSIEAEPIDVAPRPISVWFLIALFVVFSLLYVTLTARFLASASSHWERISAVPLAITLFWHFTLISISFGAAYGAFRRHRWSRWLGVAVVVAIACFMALREDTAEYANDAERGGAFMGRVLVLLLFAWWAYALAFSAKAKRYFQKSESVDA